MKTIACLFRCGAWCGLAAGVMAWAVLSAGNGARAAEEEDDADAAEVGAEENFDKTDDWTEAPVYPEGFIVMPDDPCVAVNRETGEVRVAASLSYAVTGSISSLLEFLLVSGENREGVYVYERSYESVFTTRAAPDQLHLACLLAGFRPGPLPQPAPTAGATKDNVGRLDGAVIPSADASEEEDATAEPLRIMVVWEEDGEEKSLPAERFLFDRGTQAPLGDTPWMFTGSYLVDSRARGVTLASTLTRVVGATFNDTSALFNLPFYSDNPYRSDNTGLVVHGEHLPDHFRERVTIEEGMGTRDIWLPQSRRVMLRILKDTE